MKPTNELRFVERKTKETEECGDGTIWPVTRRVLQQKWLVNAHELMDAQGEWVYKPAHSIWRDVPLEKE